MRGDSITTPGRYSITGTTAQGWQVWMDTVQIEEQNGCLGFPLDSMRTGWFRVEIQSIGQSKVKYYFDYALLPPIDQTQYVSERNPYGFNTQITETTAPLLKRSGAGWVHFEDHLTADTNSKLAKIKFIKEGDSLIASLPVTPWALLGANDWGRGSERGIGFVTARLIRQYGLNGAFRAMRTPTDLHNLDADGFPRSIEHWQKKYAIRSRIGPFRFRQRRGPDFRKVNPFLYQFPPPDTVQTHALWQGQGLPIRRSDQGVAWAARRRLAGQVIRHLDSTTGWRIGMVEAVYEPGNFLFAPWPNTILHTKKSIAIPELAAQAATQKLIIQTELGLKEAYAGNRPPPLLGAEGDIPMAFPYPNAFFNEVLNGTRAIRPHPRLVLENPAQLPALEARRDASSLFGCSPRLGALTFHPYPGNAPSHFASNAAGTGGLNCSTLRQDVDSLLGMYRRYTRRAGLLDARPDIWATETGYPSGGSKILNQWQMNEERQARYLPGHFLEAFAAGVDKVMWYGFRDNLIYDKNGQFRNHDLMPPRMDAVYDSLSADGTWGEFTWEKAGLVRATNTVKPAYAAFATLARLRPSIPLHFSKKVERIGYQRLTTYYWIDSSRQVMALMKDDPQGDTLIVLEADPRLPYHIYSAEGVLLSQGRRQTEAIVPLHRDEVTYIVRDEYLKLDSQPTLKLLSAFYPALPSGRNAIPQGTYWMPTVDSILGFAADSNLWEKPAHIRITLNGSMARIVKNTILTAASESERGYAQLGLPGDHGFRFRIPQKWKTATRKGSRFEVFVQDAPRGKWIRIGQLKSLTPPFPQ